MMTKRIIFKNKYLIAILLISGILSRVENDLFRDRYRTAAVQAGWGDYNLRLNMMTGPGSYGARREGHSSMYPYGYYTGNGVDDVRLGALSFGYKKLQDRRKF